MYFVRDSINKSTQLVSFLIEQGANVNIRTSLGWSPLSFALECGYLPVFKLLSEHGATAAVF
jgi:ankyrin repeat protein